MEGKGLGKRINMVRKDRGFTADRLSEPCNINATYLRQIEGGAKVPSLPINICNALKISPDYLLWDTLEDPTRGACGVPQSEAHSYRKAFFRHTLVTYGYGSPLRYGCAHTVCQFHAAEYA